MLGVNETYVLDQSLYNVIRLLDNEEKIDYFFTGLVKKVVELLDYNKKEREKLVRMKAYLDCFTEEKFGAVMNEDGSASVDILHKYHS